VKTEGTPVGGTKGSAKPALHWLAWSLCGLALGVISGGFALSMLNGSGLRELDLYPLDRVASAVVGGLISARRPANPVGWIFLAGALASAVRVLAGEYAIYALVTEPGALPLAWAAAWLSGSLEAVGPLLLFVFLPLYFPDGRLVSPRWRLVTWSAVFVALAGTALFAVTPGESVYGSSLQDPLGAQALQPVLDALSSAMFAIYMGLIFAAAASLVVRYHRSSDAERQQLKWLAFAAVLIPLWFVTNAPGEAGAPLVFAVLDALIIAGLPVAAGIAILRYRLYDIDVIINRTLVYGALTVMLALTYLGSVALLQGVFRTLTDSESRLAVVVSTLAIAALFNPLRRLIQGFIDRRFYRRKYNAQQTLKAFSGRLRTETSVEGLGSGLLDVTRETVQPAHVSPWLCPIEPDSEKEGRRD
jgi:hypothetical protein